MGKFTNKGIVLGVTGSIAAYKAASLLRTLVAEGANVSVVMTESAKRFLAPLTFEVLSKNPVYHDMFTDRDTMPHLSATESADILVIAPATANILAKSALGIADDLLSTMILAARCPMIMAPAMDGEMWEHPSVQAHTQTLRQRGVMVLEPEEGFLASGLIGKGRLPAEQSILEAIESLLARQTDWSGHRVLVSAGPTREYIDAVRFITNGSTGKMGYAIAEAAAKRGAEVVLVSGPTSLTHPAHVKMTSVVTADDMHATLQRHFPWATVLIMTAAVGDFRLRETMSRKVKKDEWSGEPLELERTLDILGDLSMRRTHQILVGFAAETHEHIENGKKKLQKKNLDMIAINHVGGPDSAFGNQTNELTLLTRSGDVHHLDRMPKSLLAHHLLDAILPLTCSENKPVRRGLNLRSL